MRGYNRIYLLLSSSLLVLSALAQSESIGVDSQAQSEEIFFADPTIFVENDTFYLTGTRYGIPQGFALLQSSNLREWEACAPDSMILIKGDNCYGTDWFWAPQIVKEKDGYTLTYSANEQTVISKSPSLKKRFTQNDIRPVDSSEHNIDSFIFTDDDGTRYLYHVRFDNGNYLWVGKLDSEADTIIEGTLSRCFVNDQTWENTPAYPSAPIMEGPSVLKLDGKYYLFYSANHYMSPDYAVGYAIADSPYGPWHKNPDNPIIHRSVIGENGTGHGDIFRDNLGNFYYVFHTHFSDSQVAPRRTRIISLIFQKDPDSDIYRIIADPTTVIKPIRLHKTL